MTILLLEHATILRSRDVAKVAALTKANSTIWKSGTHIRVKDWLAASSQDYTLDQFLEFILQARLRLSVLISVIN